MDSVRSSSPLFSDSDRLELPSLAQGNLISFDPEEESRNKTSGSQDRVVSNSTGIPCAQTVQDNLSQGIQTSPVMEASPVQHIQDVYGSPKLLPGLDWALQHGLLIPSQDFQLWQLVKLTFSYNWEIKRCLILL